MAEQVPFVAGMRVRASVYALVFLSAVIFSVTEGNATTGLVVGVVAAFAWWLVDARRGENKKGSDKAKGVEITAQKPGEVLNDHNEGFRQVPFLGAFFRREGRGLPKLVLNLFVLGAAVNLLTEVLRVWGNQSLIIALAHFIVALQVSKLFAEKKGRDLAQLIILSTLVVVSSVMFSTSGMLFASLMAVFVGLLAYSTLGFHLGLETHAAAQAAVPAVAPEHARLGWMRADLRRVARNCVLMVLPIALVVFMAVPRSRGAAFVTSWNIGAYQTGFSDTVQFHDYGQLNQSDAVAMIVTLQRYGSDIGRDVNDLYFRGQVLNEYNRVQARWEHGTVDEKNSETRPADEPAYDASQLVQEEYKIYMPPLMGKRFITGPAARFNFPDGYVYSPRDMTLRYMGTTRDAKSYTVYSSAQPDWEGAGDEPAFVEPGLLRRGRNSASSPARTAGATTQRATTLPAALPGPFSREVPPTLVSPEIMALARDLAKQYLTPAGTPVSEEMIRPIMNVYENYLQTHYPYSLTFKQVDMNMDPTTDFLMNRKATGGHCEYFASAMVMLCRSVGLNARMVTGFHGGEFNLFDKTYTVRQKDAHAWAEVYVPQQGWVQSDPSPMGDKVGAGGDMSLARWAHEFGQALQNYWLSLVVSFDNESRAKLMNWTGEKMQGVASYFRDLLVVSSTSDLTLKLAVFGPMMGLMVLGTWALRRWRADRKRMRAVHGPAWRTMVALSSGVGFLEELFAMLERSGTPRRMDQTPREFVEQFEFRLGNALNDARWLISTAYQVRFGDLELNSDLRNRVSAALRNVKGRLRANPA